MRVPLRLAVAAAVLGCAALVAGEAAADAPGGGAAKAHAHAGDGKAKKAADDGKAKKAADDGKAKKAADAKPPTKPKTPPELLFTFDDGPHLERTPKVLDTLAKHGIHAVFFVNGVHFQGDSPSAKKARAIMRDAIARGHAIGNHTIHHYFLCGKVYSKRADEEIEGNARLIEEAIGQRPELYRTPYGSHCPALSATLARLGLKHTGWDIDPQDWKVLDTNKVRDFIENHLKHFKSGREILLMHDIHEDTVEALPQILDWIDHENADRVKRGEPPIRIIDYSYLLPPRPAVPPILDAIGRVLIEHWRMPDATTGLLAVVAGRTPRS